MCKIPSDRREEALPIFWMRRWPAAAATAAAVIVLQCEPSIYEFATVSLLARIRAPPALEGGLPVGFPPGLWLYSRVDRMLRHWSNLGLPVTERLCQPPGEGLWSPGSTVLLQAQLTVTVGMTSECVLSCPYLPGSQWELSGPCHFSPGLLLGLRDIHTPSEVWFPWEAVDFLKLWIFTPFSSGMFLRVWQTFRCLSNQLVSTLWDGPFVSSKQVKMKSPLTDYVNKHMVASSKPCPERRK